MRYFFRIKCFGRLYIHQFGKVRKLLCRIIKQKKKLFRAKEIPNFRL